MQYDGILKKLLNECATASWREVTGLVIDRWRNVELPKVSVPRVDLLGEAPDGTLIHVELQSTNDAAMAVRMAEYALTIYRLAGAFPKQIVLYVGEGKVRMEDSLPSPFTGFRYELVDIRDLDGRVLLESDQMGDNVLAILTRWQDQRGAVRAILEKLSGLKEDAREFCFEALLTLSGLRGLEQIVEEEASKMPVLNDILDHKVLGREYKRGKQEGREEEVIRILSRLIVKRFGAIPDWVRPRMQALPVHELERLTDCVFDYSTLEELFNA